MNVRREHYHVYGGRPGPFGNPFRDGSREDNIARFNAWIMLPAQKALRERIRRELPGRKIGCFCAPQPCHLDIVAKIANGEISEP